MRLLVSDTSRPFKPGVDGATGPFPTDWFDVLHDVAYHLGKVPIEKLTWRSLVGVGRPAVVVAWHPSPMIMVARWLGHQIVYLCWGLPPKSARVTYMLKLAKLRGVLASSNTILVNDSLTADDVSRLTGRSAVVIPYVVDADYFQRRYANERTDLLLVPGSNDRNESLVSQIAIATSRRVVRVTQSQTVVAVHAGSKVEVQFNISCTRLAKLYQEAGCVLLPIRSHNHTAGQTAVLEAVASGAPVVMSAGRAGAIAQKFASVVITPSNELTDWVSAIAKADEMRLRDQDLLAQSAAQVREEHAPHVVVAKLLRAISELSSQPGKAEEVKQPRP